MPSRTRSGIVAGLTFLDQADRAHDLARRAEPALEAVMRDERRLHRMQLVAARDALDREDVGAVVADRQRQARIDPSAVDQDRARAALAAVAALLGSGQVEPLAQEIEQRDARVVQARCPRRTPFTVRLMEKLMQCSDQCYRRTGSQPHAAMRRRSPGRDGG